MKRIKFDFFYHFSIEITQMHFYDFIRVNHSVPEQLYNLE